MKREFLLFLIVFLIGSVFAGGFDVGEEGVGINKNDSLEALDVNGSIRAEDTGGIWYFLLDSVNRLLKIDGDINATGEVRSYTTSSHVMKLEPTTSPPSEPSEGYMYFDSSGAFCGYSDGEWTKLGGAGVCGSGGTPNEIPTITIDEPDGVNDTAGNSYTITWTDEDNDSDALISLYYDTDDTGEDGTLIVSGISENDEADSYSWDTSDVSDGDYYVYAIIDDGMNSTVDYSEGVVSVSHGVAMNWSEMSKILASDGVASDVFGYSVSISGDYAVVGAAWDDGYKGSAYIFKRDGTSWSEEAKILASDGSAGDDFGHSVSINGDYVVVGAKGDDENGDYSGSAYVFKRDGTSWSEEAKILASDGVASDVFGNSVSIDGDYAVVGALGDDNYKGSAYIFKRDGTSWSEEAKLTASDGVVGDVFGNSVSINGDYVIVGAYGDGDNGIDSGSAYIFRRNGTSWSEEAKILASDGAERDWFGMSVSIDGYYAVVGAAWDDSDKGSAYIFKRDGTNWSDEAKLTASDGAEGDWFGMSVSIDGDYAVVGAEGDDDNGDDSGSAYIFKRNGANWSQEAKITASDGAERDWFGMSVSIDDDYAVVGAFGDDESKGSAYIYGRLF